MKATVVLIVVCLLIAAAILLVPPALLAPRASAPPAAGDVAPQAALTQAEHGVPSVDRLTPAPEVVFTPTLASGSGLDGNPTAGVTPVAGVATAGAPSVSRPSTAATQAPADSASAPTPDVPDWTPIPATGAHPSATPVTSGQTGTGAGSGATVEATAAPNAVAPASSGPRRIYTGVSIHDVPWNMNALTAWERTVAGKSAAIVHYWVFWKYKGRYLPFEPSLLDSIRSHGSIPMITWAPEEPGAGIEQSDFQLIDIIRGNYDAYIKQFAEDARAWGKPFFLRWAHEPDGDWFPWGEDANGNQRGQYVVAWRKVHDIFAEVGASNVTWVWCPNVEFPNSPRSSYASLYPGDSYVDWICVDGYNWGNDFPANGGWSSFNQIFRYAYDTMLQVAPNKPMMLGEWASSEHGGSKAAWVRDAFGVEIPYGFPAIKAAVWYNQTAGPVDWRIESSPASIAAYRAAIASPMYVGAEYGRLSVSPVPPP